MEPKKLRKERSINRSGKLLSKGKIPILKEQNYRVLDYPLDGDAPKQFILAYFFEPKTTIRRSNSKTWVKFIAKSAEKWYPHESVVEYMINQIGTVMGLRMNETRLVIANEQIRFLSRYFLKPNHSLIHGAEICGQYLDDPEFAKAVANDKKSARDLFTFEFIEQAISHVFPSEAEAIIHDLVRMLVFDALVGNNDRHFYNWAVIRSLSTSKFAPQLAPIYDSARGLMWNVSDDNILNHSREKVGLDSFISKYIKNATPRISVEGRPNVDHFQLLSFLAHRNHHFRKIIVDLASPASESLVINLVKQKFSYFYIAERTSLIVRILEERFRKVRAL